MSGAAKAMSGSRTACLAALTLCVGALSLSTPPPAGAATVITGIASGDGGSCAVTSTGEAKCWGLNIDGQLGIGTHEGPQECGSSPHIPVGCSGAPVAVSGLGSGVAKLSSGADHTCALTSAGAVRCWGSNSSGQLGVGTDAGPDRCQGPLQQACSPTPLAVPLPIGVTATAVAAGGDHTCALTDVGGILCWGDNSSGQLGDGTTTRRTAPVAVQLPVGVTATAIAVGGSTPAH